jgi:uncharacterized YigZ family protein
VLHVVRSAEITHIARKSRFIARISRVTTREDAEHEIQLVRERHEDSSHVVYAFLTGDENSEQAGLSDDGEPHGTAGRPVMAVLRGSGIRDAVVTVVRYFGGTKLGTGGLVDAYGTAAREAIDACVTRAFVPKRNGRIVVSYSAYETLARRLKELECSITDEQYGEQVTIQLQIPDARIEEASQTVLDLTRGASELEISESEEKDAGSR